MPTIKSIAAKSRFFIVLLLGYGFSFTLIQILHRQFQMSSALLVGRGLRRIWYLSHTGTAGQRSTLCRIVHPVGRVSGLHLEKMRIVKTPSHREFFFCSPRFDP